MPPLRLDIVQTLAVTLTAAQTGKQRPKLDAIHSQRLTECVTVQSCPRTDLQLRPRRQRLQPQHLYRDCSDLAKDIHARKEDQLGDRIDLGKPLELPRVSQYVLVMTYLKEQAVAHQHVDSFEPAR
jgi:hypothetical protein